MAPTTLPNQKTATSPFGKDSSLAGMPIKLSEMLAVLPVAYIARGSVYNIAEINKTKNYIREALEKQLNGDGFAMVEILSPCPTNWHLSPVASMKHIAEETVKYYPLGVMAAGVILANAALRADKQTCWLPSYGGTMRGGTANCSVKIADEEMGSPYIDEPDVLVVFNEPSYVKFYDKLKPGGYLFVNSSLIHKENTRDDIHVVYAPVTEIAAELGNVRAANVVIVGVILSHVPMVSTEAAEVALEEYFAPKGEKMVEFNKKALQVGLSQKV